MILANSWSRNAGKCRHEIQSPDGRRRRYCERWARYGSDRCPAHQREVEPLSAQDAACVIAVFFQLLRSHP